MLATYVPASDVLSARLHVSPLCHLPAMKVILTGATDGWRRRTIRVPGKPAVERVLSLSRRACARVIFDTPLRFAETLAPLMIERVRNRAEGVLEVSDIRALLAT